MSYLYFPGCSLKSTGRGYEESILPVFEALQMPVKELNDWNCCGATAYMSINELTAFALSARNLALAEKQNPDSRSETVNLMAPCAGCYLVLNKTERYLKEFPDIRKKISDSLKSANLEYKGKVKVRHPLDILVNDFGTDKLSKQVKNPLRGLKIACYYGCQIVRPYAEFDDQHNPITMDRLMQAIGATTVDWPLKTRCCGGSLTGTIQDVGLRLSYIILREAKKRGADLVATACPLCQFNLECFQNKMGRLYHDEVNMPVFYFSQLIGLALGIPAKKLAMERSFVPLKTSDMAKIMEGGTNVRS
ncbi:MAG: CoB--CoM heterodisulfide reductase iron-sulfur subunit B family protein [candidate division Zixibacteria bacterium]|nr:CoB--CoM heterodisulfide reductase iron-sulfur subunit B family protein [candidate division Zixibacteria bacterium]